MERKYCSRCGGKTEAIIPGQDNRVRDVCTQCQKIHYDNPKIVTCTIPLWENQILLCRREIGPRRDTWTLPGGYMERREAMAEAAIRETWEEACATVVDPKLYLVANLVDSSQVHTFYRATLPEPIFGAGDETLETKLFALDEIPWHLLSFRPVFYALYYFVQDMRAGEFQIREIQLSAVPDGEYVFSEASIT